MTNNVSKNSSERPLLGAVICCTSIAPEERSILADYAQLMGAEHKLDLTSDVTHLLVGSTNTPKYQYVAREREDVKVLRPEWVKAVRQKWMEDTNLDLNALDAEYRVPVFACLKICITGFDDLNFRAEISNAVPEHGGEYTGDLTKDVTHLIAAEPAGKKFEYATIWQKKIVSMKWYHDSIERGMQLDESKYHPSLRLEEQGVDAWNRQRRKEPITGKRARDTTVAMEPVRKLRRTASTKLNSQTETMWDDIVGAGQVEALKPERGDVLRPSKSMPMLRRSDLPQSENIHGNDTNTSSAAHLSDSDKCLSGLFFWLEGYDNKKCAIVHNVLSSLGAQVCDTLADLLSSERITSDSAFIMVPHQLRPSTLPFLGPSSVQPNVVTELWLEKCMMQKTFIPPNQYPLGGLVEEIRDPKIESLTINATGFSSIETLHISKAISMTGATYKQVFTPQCSLLICKSGSVNQSKQFHAQQWSIPSVSEQWLWRFLKEGSIPAFDQHLIRTEQDSDNDLHKQFNQNRKLGHQSISTKLNKDNTKAATEKTVDCDTFRANPHVNKPSNIAVDIPDQDTNDKAKQISPADAPKGFKPLDRALKERSPNSPIMKVTTGKEQLSDHLQTHTMDGAADPQGQAENGFVDNIATSLGRNDSMADPEPVQSAIQELLNVKARVKAAQQGEPQDSKGRTKKKILGRALSNLSNSSRASNTRLSRASSIDSLNTDGIGSELAPPSASSRAEDDSTGSRNFGISLLGRARSRAKSQSQNQMSPSIDISDPNLCRDEFDEAELEPQLTQLGYEDSEEAVALRAKLAERRKSRAQIKQAAGGIQSETTDKVKNVPARRVVKDDETVLALEGQSGWGGGRRTRRKEKESVTDIF